MDWFYFNPKELPCTLIIIGMGLQKICKQETTSDEKFAGYLLCNFYV